MGLIARTRSALMASESRDMTLDAYSQLVAESMTYGGLQYGLGMPPAVTQTLGGQQAEKIGIDFAGLSAAAYARSGLIFALMLNRQLAFSTIRFQYQRLAQGRPSEMFGDQALELLEKPWVGGTTQDLLTRVINDADLAGNSYHTTETSLANLGGSGGRSLVRLRPDWVAIVLAQRASRLGFEKIGYVYREDGFVSEDDRDDVHLRPSEVAHYAPVVDPLASHRGMSWLTPVIRDIQADGLMNTHKIKFFENGATPNMVIQHPAGQKLEQVKAFRDAMNEAHQGVDNAYKVLHVGGGADVTVVGVNFEQLQFAISQGHGETRVAAAAGIPPVIVGLSEGLAAATYSNYGQARRRYADGTLHPLWQNVAGSFAPLIDSPALRQPGVRLWYDTRDVPLLREDEKDAAEIQAMQAQTIATLVREGFTWDSVKRAVMSDDYGLLTHSGLYSVQLQSAGSQQPPTDPQEATP